MNDLNVNIPIDEFNNLQCNKCGSLIFTQMFEIKVIPNLYSPSGDKMFMPNPLGIKCIECGEIEDFIEIKLEGVEENGGKLIQ